MQDQNTPDLFPELEFDNIARTHIRSMASWAMVIVAVAVIGYVLSLIEAFSASPTLSTRSEGFELVNSLTTDSKVSVFVTVAVGLLINFFLYKFASQVKQGIDGMDQQSLSKSFGNLKLYFMITSIIVVLVFVILFLVFLLSLVRSA